jgi:branched-chain amino acid transport system permease protein
LTRFLQFLFDGLSSGAIYALIALGLVIIYRASGQLNFAQGEMAMASAFLAWWYTTLGATVWVAVVLAAATAAVLAAGLERAVIRPIARKSHFAVTVASIGLFLGLNALPPFAWRVLTQQRFPSLFPNDPGDFVRIGGATWRYESILQLVVTLVVAGMLFVLFQRTKLGLAMRSVASNPESAPLIGIKTGQVLMVSWALAAAVGAVGGALVASQRGNVGSGMMFAIFFSAVAAAMLGGFDSLLGAVVAGLLLGVVENMVAGYQPDLIGQELRGSVSLIIILVVLLFRPSGLFGSKQIQRV